MPFTVAILGRPNVGKSTLFNRLVGKQQALVDDLPGVTRDRREGEARLGPLTFRVIDTAGLEEADAGTLEAEMRRQTEAALADADVALMLIDARSGPTPIDAHFARWLRRQGKPVVLAANKCEGRGGAVGQAEAYALGLGDPLPLSAAHGEGLDLLYEALSTHAPDAAELDEEDEAADGPLRLAILGRPNVGKSTLVNRLLGEDRMITGPEAGITRDAIGIDWAWQGRPVRLFDTAGLRRQARISQRLEKLSAEDALRAMRFAQVVVLLVDAEAPLEKQELTLAARVVEEGRAMVLAVNKWDLVGDRRAAMQTVRDRLETSLPQVRGLPIVTLSALTGKGVDKLMPAVFDIYDRWQARIPTARLNEWLEQAVERHPPPLAGSGRRLRLRFMTQAKTRPPTFVIFANRPVDLPESYVRYLQNGIRELGDLDGVPIRVNLRRGKNPYDNKKKS